MLSLFPPTDVPTPGSVGTFTAVNAFQWQLVLIYSLRFKPLQTLSLLKVRLKPFRLVGN